MSKKILVDGAGAKVTQISIFKMIWHYSDNKSFISGLPLGKYIGTEREFNIFAHILSKADNRFPLFVFYARNIALLTPDEHTLYDHGDSSKRKAYTKMQADKGIIVDWDKLYNLGSELKDEYNKYFPKTKDGIIGYKYDFEEMFAVISKLNKEFFDSLKLSS